MAVTDPFDEKELLLRLQQGEESAFNEIYERYKEPIARNLLAFLKDEAETEDALQELFFRLWDKRGTLEHVQSLSGYLFRISANMAQDHFRRLERDRRLAAQFWDTWQAHQSLSQYGSELDEALYQAIERLPAQRKRVFVLCKLQAKSYQEVADMLHITTDAVKDHITKANKFLKANFRHPDTQAFFALFVAAQLLDGAF